MKEASHAVISLAHNKKQEMRGLVRFEFRQVIRFSSHKSNIS